MAESALTTRKRILTLALVKDWCDSFRRKYQGRFPYDAFGSEVAGTIPGDPAETVSWNSVFKAIDSGRGFESDPVYAEIKKTLLEHHGMSLTAARLWDALYPKERTLYLSRVVSLIEAYRLRENKFPAASSRVQVGDPTLGDFDWFDMDMALRKGGRFQYDHNYAKFKKYCEEKGAQPSLALFKAYEYPNDRSKNERIIENPKPRGSKLSFTELIQLLKEHKRSTGALPPITSRAVAGIMAGRALTWLQLSGAVQTGTAFMHDKDFIAFKKRLAEKEGQSVDAVSIKMSKIYHEFFPEETINSTLQLRAKALTVTLDDVVGLLQDYVDKHQVLPLVSSTEIAGEISGVSVTWSQLSGWLNTGSVFKDDAQYLLHRRDVALKEEVPIIEAKVNLSTVISEYFPHTKRQENSWALSKADKRHHINAMITRAATSTFSDKLRIDALCEVLSHHSAPDHALALRAIRDKDPFSKIIAAWCATEMEARPDIKKLYADVLGERFTQASLLEKYAPELRSHLTTAHVLNLNFRTLLSQEYGSRWLFKAKSRDGLDRSHPVISAETMDM